MILGAGAYDVSSRLLAENLKVDDGWVTRKNPEVIVKITDSSVLGSGVSSTAAAAAVSRELAAREGWSGIDAVRNHRVLLISREMLGAPWLRLAAEILIARCGNRELFADVDPQKMMEMLAEEATGSLPGGIFHYQAGEE
jgi:ABC-type Fe3+-hydroxamate transport system substrate-binding protein